MVLQTDCAGRTENARVCTMLYDGLCNSLFGNKLPRSVAPGALPCTRPMPSGPNPGLTSAPTQTQASVTGIHFVHVGHELSQCPLVGEACKLCDVGN